MRYECGRSIFATERHILELGSLSHTEAMLFIDDDEPEIFESDIVLEESVGTDDDVRYTG